MSRDLAPGVGNAPTKARFKAQLPHLKHPGILATGEGIEPSSLESESSVLTVGRSRIKCREKSEFRNFTVLPLHYHSGMGVRRNRTYPCRMQNEVTKLYASALLFIYIQKIPHLEHSSPPNIGLNSTMPFLGHVQMPVSGSKLTLLIP